MQPTARRICFGSTPVARDQLPKLIGMQGATIKRLEAESGAKLVIVEPSTGRTASVHFFAPSHAESEAAQQALADTLGTNLQVCLLSGKRTCVAL